MLVLLSAFLLSVSVQAQGVREEYNASPRLIHSIVERTNNERVSQGLPPLKIQDDLNRASLNHARDMVKFGYFAHATPNAAQGDENYEDYTRAVRYPGRAGQNLYHGEAKATTIVEMWMNSPDHRANILDTHYNEIGIGLARGRDVYDTFCVQFFGIHEKTYPVIINNEAYSTHDTVVHLYLYGKDRMKQMRFSADGVTFTAWEPFQSERDWQLLPGEGERTLYVEMTDGVTTFRSSDTIVLSP